MKDPLHGSAKGAINTFITGYSEKGNASLVLIQKTVKISTQEYKIF